MLKKIDIKRMRLSLLKPAPYNPRIIDDKALEGLNESVGRFGLVQPIIWNKRTKHVVGGHQRLKILQKQGEAMTDVVVIDLPLTEEKALNIALNNPKIEGEFTGDLFSILDEIQKEMPELYDSLQFDGLRADVLIADAPEDGETDPDDIPALPLKAKTKRGDRIILGRHVLYCGDSSSSSDVDKLLLGTKIHLVNTDPPYNVKAEPRSNNAISAGNSSFPKTGKATHKHLRAKDRQLLNDSVSAAEFDKLLAAWFGSMSRTLVPGRSFYIWGGYLNCASYPKALENAALHLSQAIIWVKNHAVLNRKDFMGDHEWCFYGWREDAKNLVIAKDGFSMDHKYAFYGWKEGAAHYFNPGIMNARDVWDVKKVSSQLMVHLTEKPVELAVNAMLYSSRPGENVLDLFGGSGSTLIAAEQMNRKAFLMEMDPLYCDVIVERWEKFTKGKAQR